MALKVYKISNYDHVAEQKQFEDICSYLKDIDGYIIGNFNIEGVELDALLITPSNYTILEFKNWGGNIVAGENGNWTADGMIIAGGAGNKNPYKQAQINRSRVTKGLSRLLEMAISNVDVHIIFWKESSIDDSGISPTVKQWLHIYDNRHLNIGLKHDGCHTILPAFFDYIPQKLAIESYAIKEPKEDVVRDTSFVPSIADEFYEALDGTLTQADIRKVYGIYKGVLTQVIEQRLRDVRLQFATGLAAKIDYLLKEHNADKDLRQCIQNTRSRLRYVHNTNDEKLMAKRYEDLRNICLFVQKILNIEVPQNLSQHFPKYSSTGHPSNVVMDDCIRVVVDAWNEELIFATAADQSEKVIIPYTGDFGYTERDWSYLHPMLYVGAQLNLIRPRKKEDYYVPELIILNPDYLIDVSTICSCFETYAQSGYVNIVKKFQPSATTQAILLGNFASQLLDETIHTPLGKTYAQSIKDFVKKNAITMATCQDLDSASFHKNAQDQGKNIRKLILSDLTKYDKSFDIKNTILEPSFYCEMLGIQGRMDMLQLDYNLLIEQKSGKCEWPEPTLPDDVIRHKEQHYVQLLLYLAILHYVYKKPNDEIYAFLLYSKYSTGLIKEGPAPDLLFEVLKVRNQIALYDLLYSQGNNIQELLSTLTPDSLNQKKITGKLWEVFIKPKLTALFAPIQQASELEKAYYFRMLKFVQTEQIHAKLGTNGRNDAGQSAIWNNSLEEKKQAGNIYDNLRLRSPQLSVDGVSELIMDYSDDASFDMANFRKGDIVVLYSYKVNDEPDACKTMVYRATIVDIQPTYIRIKLRFAQSDPHVFERNNDEVWAIEHDYMESSFSSLYKGIHSFLSAPKQRRDLILSQVEPSVDEEKSLLGEYGQFNDLVLRVKQANDLFLIIGPPGTGKTSYGLVNILKEELLEPSSSILLMSYTNRAVDEICDKLKKEGIDYIRIGSETSCPAKYQNRLLENIVNQLPKIDDIKETIRSARVFVGTTTSINANSAIFTLKQFNLAIIDEASQILEPHLIGLLSAQNNNSLTIRKFVLIGDHKQLPAVVQQTKQESKVAETDILQSIGLKDCAASLFERLLYKYRSNKSVVYMMTKQGRMHPDIAAFPNYEFYQNKLDIVPIEHQKKQYPLESNYNNGLKQILETRPVSFIAIPQPTDSPSDKVNLLEAEAIASIVVAAYEQRKSEDKTIGVIVPYRNQITTVRQAIDKRGIEPLHEITIDTVERYQGSQRDVIIYGFTIQKLYQLNFLTSNIIEEDGALIDRKLNVAMTRAKENLILVGNPQLLSENYTFYKLIEFIKTKQGYFDIPLEQLVKGEFSVPARIDTVKVKELTDDIYDLSTSYKKAFEQLVIQPIKSDYRTYWPDYILGNEWNTNRALISYGRIDFRNTIMFVSDRAKREHHLDDMIGYTPHDQVLIYAFIMMRMHYCSAKAIYDSKKMYLSQLVQNYQGRMSMIDFGCGPATCAIAMKDVISNNFEYIGIDVSSAMKNLGASFIEHSETNTLSYQFINAFSELDDAFWEIKSELPSLFVFNFSYFFSNVNPLFITSVMTRLIEIMHKYPLNKYIFIVQQSNGDNILLSYRTFTKMLSNATHQIIAEDSSFSYRSGYEAKNIDFYYTIYESH